MTKIIIFVVLLSIVSCNVLPKSSSLKLASSPVELGVVVEQKKGDTHIFGIPSYNSKIKLSVLTKSFNNKNYRKYLKSIKGTSTKDVIKYIDSIPVKPSFVELEIIDNVGVVKAINEENPDVFNYLKKQNDASLVSKVSTVVSQVELDKIKKADAFYLQTAGNKQQYLMAFKGNTLLVKINLYGTQVFGYELSSFCWEITKSRKIKIATMIGKGQRCTNETEEKASKLIDDLTKTSFKF